MSLKTLTFSNKPKIISTGSIVGKNESEGPIAKYFDETISDGHFGMKTWEQAETKLQQTAFSHALTKATLSKNDIECVLSGDLLNQCVASSFACRDLNIPYIGLYGACSTFVEGLALAASLVDSGLFSRTAVCVSSHFCTAERQYRNPLAYGGQRPPTAQRTVTGSGCAIISNEGNANVRIVKATFGSIVDSGISDANNMGAAMAPAAYETLKAHFNNTNTSPTDYDIIATGDLGKIGGEILCDLFSRDGVNLADRYMDCGCKMFDIKNQDMHAGGSGCASAATVFSAYLMQHLNSGKVKHILLAGTGSLQSPLTVQQKETIPGVCHVVDIVSEK